MKNKVLKTIRFTSLLLVILLFLPTFSLWAVEAPEAEAADTAAAEVQAQNASLSAALTASMEEGSMLFRYVDRASFIEAGHIERVPEDEELNTYVFKNPDGSKTMYFLGEDVKYLSAQGVQQEKQLDLVALDGGYTTRSSNLSLALPDSIAKGVTLAYNGNSVTLTPALQSSSSGSVSTFSGLSTELVEGTLSVAPIGISTGKADYQGVFGAGTTLRYTPTLSGVKEDVILDAYRGKNEFSFTLSTESLSVFEENGQYFIAESAESEEKIHISETWVYDSADHFEPGTLTVTPVKTGLYLLTVGASVEFLTDSKTVYPVYIDPTLTVNSGNDYIEDAAVYSGKETSNYGSAANCAAGTISTAYGVARTAVRLPGIYDQELFESFLPGNIFSMKYTIFPGAPAPNCVLNVHALNDYSWQENTVTWSILSGIGYSSTIQSSVTVGTAAVSFDITDLAKAWCYSDFLPDNGFMIKAADETLAKRFYSSEGSTSRAPYVTMTYLADGVYRLKNMNSSLYMQTVGAKNKDQTRVSQTGIVNTDPDRLSQLWKVAALEDGTFSVRPMHDPTMGLSVFTNASGQQLVGIRPTVLRDNAALLDDTAQWRIAPTSIAGGLSIRTNDTVARALRAEDDSTQSGKYIVTGTYDNYYFDSWLFEEVTDVTPGILLYDTETGERLDGTLRREIWVNETKEIESLNIKPVYYSSASIAQTLTWNSLNPQIVSVDSSVGTITGEKHGTSVIQIKAIDGTAYASLNIKVNHKAIIILPGMMGSELVAGPNNTEFEEGTYLWSATMLDELDADEIVSRVASLRCNSSGVSLDDIVAYNNKYGAKDVYKELYLALEDEYSDEYVIELFAYDWRLSNQISANSLDDFIESNDYTQVVLVAHSMGGLVASGYLAKGEEQRNRVETLITIGTPFLGSTDMVYLWGGDQIEDSVDENTFGIVDGWAWDLLLNLSDPAAILVSNLPSVYELFPTEMHFSAEYADRYYLVDGADAIETYSETKEVLSEHLVGYKLTLADNAEAFHDSLYVGNEHITSYVNTYYLSGYNLDYIDIFRISTVLNDWEAFSYVNKGDGTVAVWSSALSDRYSNDTFYVNSAQCGGHTNCLNNATVQSFIIQLIDDNPSVNLSVYENKITENLPTE